MKKSIFIFLFLANLSGFAKSWLVSNITPTADFVSLTLAHAQVQAGDTIFVEGSGTPYDGVTLTKKLVLIGPGYFLTENPNTHYNKKSALIKSQILFEAGSSGSEILGFDLKTYGANIIIKENKITIKRNRLNGISFYHNKAATYNDFYITQNYIEGKINEWRDGYDPLIITKLVVSNNYINAIDLSPRNNESALSALIENNIFIDGCGSYNSIIRNNIFTKTSYNSPYYIFEKNRFNEVYNNVFTYSAPTDLVNFQLGSNNQWLINRSTIFVDATNNSTDGQWQLLPNSPAKSAGSDGSDCGMFGGATPYQLSGLPPVPVVYDIIGPDLQSGKVTVKARAIR
jgi:hypothetical protein